MHRNKFIFKKIKNETKFNEYGVIISSFKKKFILVNQLQHPFS